MNRIQISLAALLGALMPLVFDSALKGAALLAAAAVCALVLYKASAAIRHLVWLVAVVALLVVPVLSVILPGWRVLPQWAVTEKGTERTPGTEATPVPGKAISGVAKMPPPALPSGELPFRNVAHGPGSTATVSPVPESSAVPQILSVPQVSSPVPWLPLAWAAGFALLALRLLAAHLMLRRAARRCTALTAPPDEFIAAAFKAACAHLGVRQRIALLLDEKRTIPVVWGVFRPQLLLPAEAREWNEEQLRSVLLHELAHIRRRDTLVQWITQIACALHWFNPLVWLAAWRLHAERERACDDLVLASGVRPSAYAEHLLHVATKLSPARWTAACGLAMARKSSLEGRLLAVLSEKLNRRGLTRALTAAALLLAAAVAIPLAMLRAADEKTEAKTGARLQPDSAGKLKWGEPVNGLRIALAWPPALGDTLLGKEPHFQLVVQNVSEKVVHFIASDEAANPRKMLIREGERIIQALSDSEVSAADWKLQPGQYGVLRMFTKEGDKDGAIPGSALESDLSKIGRYHAIVQMEIAKAPAGAWTGKIITGQTRGSADAAAAPAPKHKDARALYEVWQRYVRANGDIPGALVGELAAAVRQFIRYNPTWETVPKLNEILPRLDATHDWKSADAIALLDELAAVKDSPLSMAVWKGTMHTIRKGEALPEKFADAAWSGGKANALRAAWVLEPGAAEHRIGAALKARLLVWNPGAVPVMLQVPTWHQGEVKATDAKGVEVEVSGISWTTIAESVPARLGPGEYIEINTPGVGFGPRAGMGPWAGPRVGSNVLAKPGDDITLTHSPVPLDGSEVGVREDDPHVVGPGWWLAHIKARLNRELPLPADAAGRTRLLDRAVRELFATAPTAEETAAFVADTTPDALEALVQRLAARADVVSFSGTLPTAPAKFRVLAADANADKQPRVVLGPGEYPLSTGTTKSGAATLKIVGRPVGDRRTNDAQILFEAAVATGKLPPNPHKLEVPDGWGTWAIVCRPNEGFFYVLHKGTVRKIDYSNPAKVTDTLANDLAAEFRDEVKRQLDIHEISESEQVEIFEKPAAPAAAPTQENREPKTVSKLAPEAEAQLDWGEPVNGLRAAVAVRVPKPGAAPGIFLAVQNVSAGALRFSDTIAAERLRTLYVSAPAGRILFALTNGEPTKIDAMLQPREVAFLPMFPPGREKEVDVFIEGLRKDSLQTWKVVLEIEKAPAGAWKGTVTTAETRGATGTDGPQPKSKEGRALFKFWQDHARLNGNIPGGLLNRLHDKVKEFIRNNSGDASGDPYAKKMAPLELRFGVAGDWKPADVVSLMDDIAAVTTIPLETTMDFLGQHTLQHGQSLPAALARADWGEPLEGGLRMAFLLEPRAEEYHLGTEVKARILLHNSGKEPVAFVTSGFQQPGHKARLADGGELKLDSTHWTTRGRPNAYRLGPGEYCEVYTPGLGIGAQSKDREDWANVRAGSWILCSEGDEVIVTPGAALLARRGEQPDNDNWWLEFITERLSREAPVPLDTKEREYLLYRVVRDLFGTAPSTTEGDAFAADKSPDALKNLAVLLTKHAYGKQCHGMIHAGETKFRVLPADPDAAKRTRVAMNPGYHNLGDIVRFSVTRRPQGEGVVNEASLIYFPQGKDNVIHKVKLPGGYNTWVAAWEPGTTVMWVSEKGLLRSFDFTDPAKVQETRYEADKTATAPLPAKVRAAIGAALTVPDAPKQETEPLNPPPAAPAPATPKKTKEGADAKPKRIHLFDDKFSAVAVQSGDEVKFVLCHRGFLSTGMSDWSYGADAGWGFEGHVHLVDRGKTRAAGKNVNARSIAVKYTSAAPDTIFLDGKGYDLANEEKPGRVFILQEKGEPLRSDRTMALRDMKDLVKLGELADVTLRAEGAEDAPKTVAERKLPPVDGAPVHPRLADERYAKSGVPLAEQTWPMPPWGAEKEGLSAGIRVIGDARIGGEVKVELWVRNSGAKDVKFSQNSRADVGLSVVAKNNDGKEHHADITQFSAFPVFHHLLLPAGHGVKVKEFKVKFCAEKNDKLERGWVNLQLTPGTYKLRAKWSDSHALVTHADDWTGELTSGEVDLKLLAN